MFRFELDVMRCGLSDFGFELGNGMLAKIMLRHMKNHLIATLLRAVPHHFAEVFLTTFPTLLDFRRKTIANCIPMDAERCGDFLDGTEMFGHPLKFNGINLRFRSAAFVFGQASPPQ